MPSKTRSLRLGLDIGSTTVKVVVVDPESGEILFSRYVRHNARQREVVLQLLQEVTLHFPGESFRVAVCGSGGKVIADALGMHYIQEVVANSAAVKALYPQTRCAIELGGQDAKVIFFYYDEKTQQLMTSDMRMNGSCAGGTGAFIDEIAELLHIPTEQFESLAQDGNTVYNISGRCGVFAKTDIQPLLISGAKRADIALSTIHAIAKQTIGGLSQGLELKPPIIFEGGTLNFNPTLISLFAERLNLSEEQIIIPQQPEIIVAYGTAIAIDRLFTPQEEELVELSTLIDRLSRQTDQGEITHNQPFFADTHEFQQFTQRHDQALKEVPPLTELPKEINAYLGVDSGSTTSKFVLINEEEEVIYRFYAHNHGEPLRVVRDGLIDLYQRCEELGIRLTILGLGTTGYGEQIFASAFHADYHTVETVAHAQACVKYYPNTTFLLDIGGQDMKAIWLNHGVITQIMLNEACSSGCGSFLENFAKNLHIPVEEIAEQAFTSENPAKLGSRCTVFMNSTIITEQRNGKQPNDLMAGLCRSIIENVFTKVVRIGSTAHLGDHIVVQGGTFRNRAVLRAMEEYIGLRVQLAPYPGEMGALGAALGAKQAIEERGYSNGQSTSFIGLPAMASFEYHTQNGVPCEGCANHCSRTITYFSNGSHWVTGNRCERGAILDGEPANASNNNPTRKSNAIDLFDVRERLLFQEYPCTLVAPKKQVTIGIPRVLEFWNSMPFWSTFFRALGFQVRYSGKSNQAMYEEGLQYVASDTICFPAKLVHGHLADLVAHHVDRLFMPYVMHMPPEGTDKLSPYVCSVIMGYPMVARHSQKFEQNYHIPFDTPVFHWYKPEDRQKQVVEFAVETLSVSRKQAKQAYQMAENAILSFRADLTHWGEIVLNQAKKENTYAVVVAGRPYQSDSFVNHRISKNFTQKGISVLTVDSLPHLNEVDLHRTTIEITNNFHTRMLAGAMIAAQEPALEYVQIVSFGCGHDAILSDEIVRIMAECGNKIPLILKVDESEAKGALNIRTQSFLETVEARRKRRNQEEARAMIHELSEPSPVKFRKEDKKRRTILVPNISAEFSQILYGTLRKEGFTVKTVPLGGPEEMKLGKKYVHNDICFPAQMVIGELIRALQEGDYKQDEVAVGMVKFQCDCRLSHYGGLLRKGLDNAGFKDVAILTTDVNDTKEMHPNMNVFTFRSLLSTIWSIMMLDVLTELRRKIRPYELHKGETNCVYERCVKRLEQGTEIDIAHAKKAFAESIEDMKNIAYDRSVKKPLIFVTGEILVTFHAGTNCHIEDYLEANGMETAFPAFMDQQKKDFQSNLCQVKDFKVNQSVAPYLIDILITYIQKEIDKIAVKHPLYEVHTPPKEMYKLVKDIIPETLSPGEGWLMAADIAHLATQGVKAFIILQPFGCLPNHPCGRGVIKRLKEEYPDIQILPLDLDPDTSFANIENRLQMLIMNK